MKAEKTLLITLFTIFFALSAGLMFLMIKKDIIGDLQGRMWLEKPLANQKPENNWPKVEIQTSKN